MILFSFRIFLRKIIYILQCDCCSLKSTNFIYLQGLDNIEGLVLDLSQSTKKQINSQIFERLPRLRLLEIINAHDIKGHFKNSFHELRCFYWNCCTWTKLPSSFRPQKLISLVLPYSNLKMLWDDAQVLIGIQYSSHTHLYMYFFFFLKDIFCY